MTIYDDDFIKQVMGFNEPLEGNWFEELDKPEEHTSLTSKPQWKIHLLQYAVRVLFAVIKYQMKDANRIHSILEKLANKDDVEAIKEELKQVREEAVSALIPIKKLSKSLEESKNKKTDYIR